VTKPVVLIAEELSPATVDALGPDFEIRRCDGANRSELLAALVDVDAVLIRSATKMDQEALAAAKVLKVVARAGVGLDNVDVKAATMAGVMVVNAPTSNITSAAELAVGLLLATARNIAPANQALKGGRWKRSQYGGVELLDKTVGIVGLGRIGALTAERLSGFGMKMIAYDPYLSTARAGQLGVRLVSLDDLLRWSDFITVHLPKTPGGPQARQAVGAHHQRGSWRHRGRTGPVQRAEGRPGGRRRHRRLGEGAVYPVAAVRVRVRRGHPAPRCLDARGPGEGRHCGRQIGPTGTGR
jgi:phosphoglycerate dehydrogenase-like enzyme